MVGVELEGQRTGVGRYLEELLAGVCESDLDWQWLVYLREPSLPGLFEDPRIHPVLVPGRRSAVAWEQLDLPAALDRSPVDLLFSPAYSLPLAVSVPRVVTLHDLSFEVRPKDFRPRERWRRRLLARLASRRAARVLADTRSIGDQVGRLYAVEADRIGVVPAPFDLRRWADAVVDPAWLHRLGVRTPYLLFLGTLLDRRGLGPMLAAAAVLRREDPELRLVIAGRVGLAGGDGLEGRIAEAGLAGAVDRLGWVEEAALPALYRHAEATLYLSAYEGFGLPPLESLACGTPAVVMPGLALDELWPEYPFRVAGADPGAVAATVVRARVADRSTVAEEAGGRFAPLARRAVVGRLAAELERAVAP